MKRNDGLSRPKLAHILWGYFDMLFHEGYVHVHVDTLEISKDLHVDLQQPVYILPVLQRETACGYWIDRSTCKRVH